jgi:acyl dehydratase
MTPLTNVTFDEIKMGQSATISRTLSQMDIEVLAYTSGDADAYHLEEGQTVKEVTSTEGVAAQAFFGHLLNRRLPGPGTTIVAADFQLRGRLSVGDAVSATVTAKEKRTEGGLVIFDCQCINQKGEMVATGVATVVAPKKRVAYAELATPEVIFRRTDVFARLIRSCQGLHPVKTAVVHPCDHDSLVGPIEAATQNLIIPVFVGPESKIRARPRWF